MSRVILCEEVGTPRSRCIVLEPRPGCDPLCGERDQPQGYVAAALWAEEMMRDHRQECCPGCGRWTIWRPCATADDLGWAVAS